MTNDSTSFDSNRKTPLLQDLLRLSTGGSGFSAHNDVEAKVGGTKIRKKIREKERKMR